MKHWVGLLAISLSFSSSALAMSVLSSEGQDYQVEQEKFVEDQNHALIDATCTTPGNCSGNPDYYAELERLFEEGTIPSNSEVMGWLSGRCYYAWARTTAKASLLVGLMESVGENNGPLFPEVFKFLALQYDSKSADIFDNLTPALEAEFSRIIESGKKTVQAPCVEDNSLSVSYLSCGTYGLCGTVKLQVRKAQNYLLLKQVVDNRVAAYCYHFKKVK
jgi:hypothetical protein